jgi:formate hydrogenlyase transcriptional activator
MGVKVKKDLIFREATLRICGNLEIDKALREFFLYIRKEIPADFMTFIIYHPQEEAFESIANAYAAGSDTLSVKFPVPLPYRKRLKTDYVRPRITIIEEASQDVVSSQIAKNFGWEVSAGIFIEMVLAEKPIGALGIFCKKKIKYTTEHADLLTFLNEPLGIALTNSLRYRRVRELKNQLVDDKRYLQDELRQITFQKIVGEDYGLKGVMDSVRLVSYLNNPVLLLGETGVGKEVVAMAIHNASSRRKGPFITVNCGAITETLIDSELFGHEKGAFTGAIARKRGRFERAQKGTIFLDEIGELPPEAQVRLLRVHQKREIEPVCSEHNVKVDSRVIAATHRDLEKMIQQGLFREDLYFRLKVFPIIIPPLKEHLVDIPALVQHFIHKKSREMALPSIATLAPGALDDLMAYHWPGNVRELENAVERALIIYRDQPLVFPDLQTSGECRDQDVRMDSREGVAMLDTVIRDHIHRAMKASGGRVEGAGGASDLLGINSGTLRQRMRKLKIPFGRKAKGLYQ